VLRHIFVEVFHQDDDCLLQLRVAVSHLTGSAPHRAWAS
jgi:hypothetical protein